MAANTTVRFCQESHLFNNTWTIHMGILVRKWWLKMSCDLISVTFSQTMMTRQEWKYDHNRPNNLEVKKYCMEWCICGLRVRIRHIYDLTARSERMDAANCTLCACHPTHQVQHTLRLCGCNLWVWRATSSCRICHALMSAVFNGQLSPSRFYQQLIVICCHVVICDLWETNTRILIPSWSVTICGIASAF